MVIYLLKIHSLESKIHLEKYYSNLSKVTEYIISFAEKNEINIVSEIKEIQCIEYPRLEEEKHITFNMAEEKVIAVVQIYKLLLDE